MDLVVRYAASIKKADADVIVVSDVDTTWMRPWDDSESPHGFLFATCTENPVSFENRDILKRKVRFLKDYCRVPGDMRKILFPMAFVSESPLLQDIASQLEEMIPEAGIWPPHIKEWETIMNLIKSNINRHGLRDACAHEDLFSVIPWFWQKGKQLQDGSVNIT